MFGVFLVERWTQKSVSIFLCEFLGKQNKYPSIRDALHIEYAFMKQQPLLQVQSRQEASLLFVRYNQKDE